MGKREEIKNKVIEMLDDSRKKIEANLDKILDSGAVAIDDYEGGYFLPKAIIAALYREEMEQFSLNNKKFKEETDNIYTMI